MEQIRAVDDRADSFLQVGDVAKRVAESHSNISIDGVTHERWRQLMGLLREVDTLVDDTSTTKEQVLLMLSDFTPFSDRYPALAPEVLGENIHKKLLGRTQHLLRLGEFVANATSVERFVKLRISEGRQTANLLEDSATSYVLEQPDFYASFLPAMQSLGVAASTIDSITDARADYRNHKIALTPSSKYYGQLAKVTMEYAPRSIDALLHPAIMKEFAVMSMVRLRNRIRHGMTDSSSLNNFH